MGLSSTLTTLIPEDGLPLLALDDSSRSVKLEAVLMLGGPRIIEAAHQWHDLAWRFQHWAMGTATPTTKEVEEAYVAAQAAREAYYAAVRDELRV